MYVRSQWDENQNTYTASLREKTAGKKSVKAMATKGEGGERGGGGCEAWEIIEVEWRREWKFSIWRLSARGAFRCLEVRVASVRQN